MSGCPRLSNRYRTGCTPNVSSANTGSRFSRKRRSKSALWAMTSTTRPQQIVDGAIVDAVTDDHLIGNAGNLRDLGRDRNAGIFEPLPGAENFVDPSALTVIFEEADAEFDDFVAIGVGAGSFHVDDGGDEPRTIVGWVIFGLGLQSIGDAIIAAFDKRPSHLFERIPHLADVPNRFPRRPIRQGAELR